MTRTITALAAVPFAGAAISACGNGADRVTPAPTSEPASTQAGRSLVDTGDQLAHESLQSGWDEADSFQRDTMCNWFDATPDYLYERLTANATDDFLSDEVFTLFFMDHC